MIRSAHIGLLVGAALLGACVKEEAAPPAPMCVHDTDCATNQTCQAGTCFAAPTSLQLAAEVFAPANRPDMLARAEIKPLAVDSGHVTVMFVPSIEYSGRVVLHSNDPLSAAAKVVFHRASRIPGAPDYEVVVDAMPDKGPGEAAFTARLVQNMPGETYDIQIYPDDGTLFPVETGQDPPNRLAPPVTISGQTINAAPSNPVTLTCDSAGLRELDGTVVDAVGAPMAGMMVQAFSEPLNNQTEPQLVSSTGVTDASGHFVIFEPVNRTDSFDLVVTPGSGMVAPALRRKKPSVVSNMADTSAPIQLDVVRYPFYPSLVSYQLPVTYANLSGGQSPATGARVLFTTVLLKNDQDLVTFEADASVDATGYAKVSLIPGADTNRSYAVSVLPLQNQPSQSVWDMSVVVGPAAGSNMAVLSALQIRARVQVTGLVIDALGRPADKVTLRPQLSSTFLGTLAASDRDRVSAMSLPEVVTANGLFTVYLDPTLLSQAAVYDFAVVPPSGSSLPQWSFDSLSVPVDKPTDALDNLRLPPATLVTGQVTDDSSPPKPVAGADVRVYAAPEAGDSSGSWKLRYTARSDDSGGITLVLPSKP